MIEAAVIPTIKVQARYGQSRQNACLFEIGLVGKPAQRRHQERRSNQNARQATQDARTSHRLYLAGS